MELVNHFPPLNPSLYRSLSVSAIPVSCHRYNARFAVQLRPSTTRWKSCIIIEVSYTIKLHITDVGGSMLESSIWCYFLR